MSGCIADPETAVDFRALEDEESQIQSIFAEALLLKKQCRQLTMQLMEQESHFHREVTRLQRQVKERDSQLLQMEMEAENEYELKMQSNQVGKSTNIITSTNILTYTLSWMLPPLLLCYY